jgi:hypothetical protein
VGACREGCFHAHFILSYPHKHHKQSLTAPWHPALSAISPPLAPRRVHRPRDSSTATAHQHHRWKCSWSPPHEPCLLLAAGSPASQHLRTVECAPRHCCANTVVCRARRTRGSLCHSAPREVTQRAGWRVARVAPALVQAASLPRGGEAHPPHSGGSAVHPPAGRKVVPWTLGPHWPD